MKFLPILLLALCSDDLFRPTLQQDPDPHLDDPASYDYPPALGVCSRPWRPVLRLDDSGNIINGTIDELRYLALHGSLFRIKLYLSEGPYLLNVDNINVRGEHVCAESLWHLSDNGTHISTSAEWRFYLLCTNGKMTIINSPYSRPFNWSIDNNADLMNRTKDAEENYGSISNTTQSMLWYVKEIGNGQPVYSHFLDGTRVSGSLDHLMYMANRGECHCVMRDRGYALRMDNVLVNEVDREVNGQSLGHISQAFSDDALTFRLPPYHWYSSWTTDGHRDNTRYYVGTSQSRIHNNDYVALDWYVDSCWEEVYVNNGDGEPVSGSVEELIFLISMGHSVRVRYDQVVLEATALRVSQHIVIAQSITEMARRDTTSYDKYFFNTETLWKWSTIHTTGKVNTYTYRIRDMTSFKGEALKRTISWMVDKRPWKRVFSTPRGPGSNIDPLISAVYRGASIRFSLQQDVESGFFVTTADNVRVDEYNGVVYAQCLRHISDKKDPAYDGEYELQPAPFHWFLMISSDGDMAMSAWRIESRTQQYDKLAPEPNISWYCNN